jgi:hypothetical protein
MPADARRAHPGRDASVSREAWRTKRTDLFSSFRTFGSTKAPAGGMGAAWLIG